MTHEMYGSDARRDPGGRMQFAKHSATSILSGWRLVVTWVGEAT
jgi:hypothetical protein